MADRAKSDDPDWFNLRLKELAQRLAVIDGSDSAEFVMEIMMLPSQWDQWTRVDVIEALLFSGARMNAERVLEILNPDNRLCLEPFPMINKLDIYFSDAFACCRFSSHHRQGSCALKRLSQRHLFSITNYEK